MSIVVTHKYTVTRRPVQGRSDKRPSAEDPICSCGKALTNADADAAKGQRDMQNPQPVFTIDSRQANAAASTMDVAEVLTKSHEPEEFGSHPGGSTLVSPVTQSPNNIPGTLPYERIYRGIASAPELSME